MKITKKQLTKIIKEEKAQIIEEQSKEKLEGELLAELSILSDEIGKISEELPGLVEPDHYERIKGMDKMKRDSEPEAGWDLAKQLDEKVDQLNTLIDRLEIYFEGQDSPLPHAGVTTVDNQGDVAVAKGR